MEPVCARACSSSSSSRARFLFLGMERFRQPFYSKGRAVRKEKGSILIAVATFCARCVLFCRSEQVISAIDQLTVDGARFPGQGMLPGKLFIQNVQNRVPLADQVIGDQHAVAAEIEQLGA